MARTGRSFPTHPIILGALQAKAKVAGTTTFLDFGNAALQRILNPSNYAGTVMAYLEVHGFTDGTSFSARLYNVTLAAPVSGGTVTLTATTMTRYRSAGFSLDTGDNTYKVQFGGVSGGVYRLFDAALILVMS